MLTKTKPLSLSGALLALCGGLAAAEKDNPAVLVGLSLQSATIIEGVGLCLGSVTIKDAAGNPATLDDNLTMDVSTTLPGRLVVTSQVTIAAGSSSAQIILSAANDSVLEGQQVAEVHALSDIAAAHATVTVVDPGGSG